MRTSIFFAVLLLGLTVSPAYPGEPRKITYYGVGIDPCSKMLKTLSKDDIDKFITWEGTEWHSKSRVYVNWALGYITAFNEVNSKSKNIDDLDGKEVAEWLEQWCRKNPGHTVIDATRHLVEKKTGYLPGLDYFERK